MDLTALLNTILGVIEKIISSGVIEKVFALAEKTAPSISNIIINLIEIISK